MSFEFLRLESPDITGSGWLFKEYDEHLLTASFEDKHYLICPRPLLECLPTTQFDLWRLGKFQSPAISGIVQVSDSTYYEILEELSSQTRQLAVLSTSSTQKTLEQILLYAVDSGASDLHITRNEVVAIIELRINGVLTLYMQMKSQRCDELVFVLYNVEASTKDTTWNRNIPQSANILYMLNKKSYRFRYAHFPIFGEEDGCYHAVLRIIPSGVSKAVVASLDKLGISDAELSDLKKILCNPYGAYFISGTTGSGKSTTLKNLMEWLQVNRYGDKGCFLTVEDPVEYQIYGAKQSSVLNGEDGGFHAAIKSALRRDPDVLMVGEIRDNISANALAGAVESGHYCFTTVHAGNIVSLLQRLCAMGITSDKLSTPGFLAGLQCQKLIPILCNTCKKATSANHCGKPYALFARNAEGCTACKNTGVASRQLVVEYMLPTHAELEFIAKEQWLQVYGLWRNKRALSPSLTEGFEIKEKVMAAVLQGRVCANWFAMEFGTLLEEDMEVLLEKVS